MAWVTLTTDHVKSRLAEDEIYAIEETGGGDGARLTGIISQVTALVRAKVAGCENNTLGDAGTIPEEALHAACAIARHNLSTTVSSAMGEEEAKARLTEYRDAMTFLTDIAECKIKITNADGEVVEQATGLYGGADLLDF